MVHAQLLQTLTVLLVSWDNRIYKGSSQAMTELPGNGRALDAALAPDGTAWVLGMSNGIYFHDGVKWQQLPSGRGKKIAVDKCGVPWVIGMGDLLHKWTGFGWIEVPGGFRGIDLAIDGKDHVWALGLANRIRIYENESTWGEYPGDGRGKKLAVARDGTPYVIGMDDAVYKGTGTGWAKLADGMGKDVSVGPSGTPWVIGMDNEAWFFVSGKWYRHPGRVPGIAISSS